MAPQPQYCMEKKRLMDAYFAATHEVLTLQDRELAETPKGGDVRGFDLALKLARSNRDAAKAACKEHIAEHGC